MTEAIVQDKVKFIQVILDQGVMMKEFLTFERLNDLYLMVSLSCLWRFSILFQKDLYIGYIDCHVT